MTDTSRGPGIGRPPRRSGRTLVALAGLVAVGLAMMACGATAPTGSPATDASPPSTLAPGATDAEATPLATPGLEGPGFGRAVTGLNSLRAYRFVTEVEAVGVEVSGSTRDTTTSRMVGATTTRPMASEAALETIDGDGELVAQTAVVIIGDEGWYSFSGAPFEEMTPELSLDIDPLLTQYHPASLFVQLFLPAVSAFEYAGQAERNDVPTARYVSTELLDDLLSRYAGFAGTWTAEAWIAEDGGHLVAAVLEGNGTDGERFATRIDLTDLDDPDLVIERPTGSATSG